MKKKIAFLTISEWWGGGQMSLLSLLRGLNRDKYDLVVISVISKHTHGYSIFIKELAQLKLDHICLKKFILFNEDAPRILRGIIRIPSLFWNMICVYVILKRQKIDLVHTYDGYSNLFGSVASKLNFLPLVYTAHLEADLDFEKTPWRLKSLVNLADIVVPTCFNFLKIAEVCKYDLRKFVPIHTGVREFSTYAVGSSQISFSSGYVIPDDDTVVIALVGRVTEQKGHKYLIEASKKVVKINPNVHILIVGNLQDHPGYVSELRKMIDANGLANRIFLTGFCSNMSSLMKRLDILVLPSLSESVPMVVLEAMQASKPVVATDIGGISEAVVDRETGLLSPVGETQVLGENLLKLVQDSSLRILLGNNGFRRVSTDFSIKQMATKHEIIYDQLIR
jgi:glycosyltransferase involved in cell wall biosynthesis